ncbi:hypothetical protein [uncultured Polaribacter sp.]|uniref:phage head spike fiber domain-containing protein n=1 Tax=uncultured Polaribacter sp. TaxID=174711 RepID=UPI00259BEC9E|nr:hypothetical protein [uncultured Polaribacter sp.]
MANTLKFGNGQWATKEGSTLAYNDENGNFKPLPFNFERSTSATRVNKDGLIEVVSNNEPRIDFKDDSNGALLLEPSRSNIIYPSDIGNEGGSPVTSSSTIISPMGDNTAWVPVATSGANRFEEAITGGTYSTGQKLTYSWYRKRISTPQNSGYIGDLSVQGLVNCTQVGSTTQIETGVNGFDRFQAVFSITDGSAGTFIRLYFGNVIGVGNSSVAYWGHQLEPNSSYATSYIPTQGSIGTRVAETASQTVPDGIIGQTEGTVFLDFKPQTLDGNSRYLSIENSSSVGSGWFGVFASLLNGSIRFRFYGDGWDIDSSLIIEKGTRYKIAFSYKDGVQTSIYINGNLINNITASLSGKSYQKIRLSEGAIGVRGDADFNDIKLYDTIKTNQELQALTKI